MLASVRRRKRARRPRAPRTIAFGLLAVGAAALAAALTLPTGGPPRRHTPAGTVRAGASRRHGARPRSTGTRPPARFAVGLSVLRLVDASRTVRLPSGASEPRTLVTYVRYPALGEPGAADVPDAPPARGSGPFPLVVFGHGFAVTPAVYRHLLQRWAQAGYVVAAPVFPLENANAPGGPDESDLVNQPADMSFVITRLLAAAATRGPFSGLVDPHEIAVGGQSDGGETALAEAYDSRFRDPRVRAALILSGARIPGLGGFTFPAGSPPLLAVQGTADNVNPPSLTAEFFDAARRPKYLLRLIGAEHLPPYSAQQPQLSIVERVAIAFMDGYLKHRPSSRRRLPALGTVPGVSSLLSQP